MRELGPDHFARLTAAKRLLELVTTGRPTPKAPEKPEKQTGLTLEQLEELVSNSTPAPKSSDENRSVFWPAGGARIKHDGISPADIAYKNVNSRLP
jgi:hypothetical protein